MGLFGAGSDNEPSDSPQRVAQLEAQVAKLGLDLDRHLLPSECRASALRRFLRARGGHVPRALAMLRQHLEWCKSMGLPAMAELEAWEAAGEGCTPAQATTMQRCIPEEECGRDKCSRPVVLVEGRRYDVAEAGKAVTNQQMLRFHAWRRERLMRRLAHPRAEEGWDEGGGGFTAVVDMEGMSMKHVTAKFLWLVKECACIDQANYPERMSQIIMINAPRLFPYVWGLIKSCVDPATRNKILVVSGDPTAILLDKVGVHGLPAKYGGQHALHRTWEIDAVETEKIEAHQESACDVTAVEDVTPCVDKSSSNEPVQAMVDETPLANVTAFVPVEEGLGQGLEQALDTSCNMSPSSRLSRESASWYSCDGLSRQESFDLDGSCVRSSSMPEPQQVRLSMDLPPPTRPPKTSRSSLRSAKLALLLPKQSSSWNSMRSPKSESALDGMPPAPTGGIPLRSTWGGRSKMLGGAGRWVKLRSRRASSSPRESESLEAASAPDSPVVRMFQNKMYLHGCASRSSINSEPSPMEEPVRMQPPSSFFARKPLWPSNKKHSSSLASNGSDPPSETAIRLSSPRSLMEIEVAGDGGQGGDAGSVLREAAAASISSLVSYTADPVDEEEAAQSLQSVRRWMDVANMGLASTAVVVVAVSFVAWTEFWWAGTLVEWVGWIGIAGIFLGSAAFFEAGIGHLGRVLYSRAILNMYVIMLTFTGTTMMVLGLICAPYWYQADRMVKENWKSLRDTIPEEVSKSEVQATLQRRLVMMAVTLVLGSACMAVPQGLALRMRRLVGTTSANQKLELDPCEARMLLHKLASFFSLVIGMAGTLYCIWAVKLSIRSHHDFFLAYSGVALSVTVVFTAVFGYITGTRQMICHGQIFHWTVHTVHPLLLLVLVAFAISTYVGIMYVNDNVSGSWLEIQDNFPDKSEAEVATWMKRKLMSVGTIILGQAGCIGFTFYNAVRLEQQYVWAGKVQRFDPTAQNVSLFLRMARMCLWRRHSAVDNCVLAWSFFSGGVQVFWMGQFALFADWFSLQERRNDWLLVGWEHVAVMDKRYEIADDYIVSMEYLTATVTGPLTLFFGVSLLLSSSYTNLIGCVVGALQFQAGMLYIITEIRQEYRHIAKIGDRDDIHLWVLWIVAIIVRFAIPLLISVRCGCKIVRAVHLFEKQVATGSHDRPREKVAAVRNPDGTIAYKALESRKRGKRRKSSESFPES